MHIVRNDDEATYTLYPATAYEKRVLRKALQFLSPGDRINYEGRRRDKSNDDYCITVFHAGGTREWRVKAYGNTTHKYQVFVGGQRVIIRGTDEADKQQVGSIRDMCFMGTSGLLFLRETKLNGQWGIVCTGKLCSKCNAQMIKVGRTEWGICDACAAICQHNWVKGAIYGGDLDIGVGEFCNICGVAKPHEKKSLLEHHLDTERELGIMVMYKNTPLSPQQLSEAFQEAGISLDTLPKV